MAYLCRFFANFFQFLGYSDNTTYTFKMPAQNVTVSAEFEADVTLHKFLATGATVDGNEGVTMPIFVWK